MQVVVRLQHKSDVWTWTESLKDMYKTKEKDQTEIRIFSALDKQQHRTVVNMGGTAGCLSEWGSQGPRIRADPKVRFLVCLAKVLEMVNKIWQTATSVDLLTGGADTFGKWIGTTAEYTNLRYLEI